MCHPVLNKKKGLGLVFLCLFNLSAWAQDTTTVRPDSLVVPDTVQAAPPAIFDPIGPFHALPGSPLDTLTFTRTRYTDALERLAELTGVWQYDLGRPGWPDGWTAYGLTSRHLAVTLDGFGFYDLLDGRARLDLLPVELLEPLRLAPGHVGRPGAVHAKIRPLEVSPPLTELRFRTGSDNFQAISALHVQDRRRTLGGRPTRLNVLFRYGGRGYTGPYDPSTKVRHRQVYGRITLEQHRWRLELANLLTRVERGAHGDVEPVGGRVFAAVYNPLTSQVRLASARHWLERNDLSLRLRLHWWPVLDPLEAGGRRTSQVTRFTNTDTLDALTRRYSLYVRQTLPRVAGQRLSFRLDAWSDALRRSTAFPDVAQTTRRFLSLSVHDSTYLIGAPLALSAGLHRSDDQTYSSANGTFALPLGPARLFAEASLTARPPSRLDLYGFGSVLTGNSDLRLERTAHARLGVKVQGGPFDLSLSAFATRRRDPIEALATAQIDSIVIAQWAEPVELTGVTAEAGWRRTARRGWFMTTQATGMQVSNPNASPEHARLAASFPEAFGDVRLGLRYLLFFGDLDLKAFVRARGWTAFRGRSFHPHTSLLPLPLSSADRFGPSGTVDLFIEAGIRTATVYLRLENMLAGSVYQGTLIVPVYPLPGPDFRLGVFWPFSN